jgi:hypothetical protein
MPFTPNWNLPYPCAGDNIDPTIFCDFSDAVDAAMVTLAEQAEFVANRPNARIDRTANANTFTAGAATTVQYDTEVFDNDGMASLSTSNNSLFVNTPGLYWASFSVGGFATFTTWTRYLMNILQAGNSRIYRKFIVNTAQSIPTDNTITGVLVCQAGDTITGNFTFFGTGGPMQMSRASLSLSFICDL